MVNPTNITIDYFNAYDKCELCGKEQPFISPNNIDMLNQEVFKLHIDHMTEDIDEYEYEEDVSDRDKTYNKTLKDRFRATKLKVKEHFGFKELYSMWADTIDLTHKDAYTYYRIKNYFEVRDVIKDETTNR